MDESYWEYRCAACGGGWMTSAPGPGAAPCAYCPAEAQLYRVHAEIPEPEWEALAEADIAARKSRGRPDHPLTCCFCGTPLERKSNASREHVLGKWLRDVPPMPESLKTLGDGEWRWTLDAPEVVEDVVWIPSPRRLPYRHEHPLFVTVGVCATCNNGWMSALEAAARPVLSELVSGTTNVIRERDRSVLARWATKTMIALEQDDRPSARAHPAQIRDVRMGRNPRWVRVWAAPWGTPLLASLRHDAFKTVDRKWDHTLAEGSITVIALGHVALLLVAVDHPLFAWSNLAVPQPWRPIWPPDPAVPDVTLSGTALAGEAIEQQIASLISGGYKTSIGRSAAAFRAPR